MKHILSFIWNYLFKEFLKFNFLCDNLWFKIVYKFSVFLILPIVFAIIFYFCSYRFLYFTNLNKFENVSMYLFSACRRSVCGTKGGGNSVIRIMLHSWVNSDITALPSFITSIIAWPPNFNQVQFAYNVLIFYWIDTMVCYKLYSITSQKLFTWKSFVDNR